MAIVNHAIKFCAIAGGKQKALFQKFGAVPNASKVRRFDAPECSVFPALQSVRFMIQAQNGDFH